MIYERAGPIKADDMAKLARLCGSSASALKGILDRLIDDEKLTLIDGMISNRRAELVIQNVMSKSEVARASVEARWAKRSTKSINEEYERNTDVILTKAKAKDTSSLRSDVTRARRASPPGFDEFWMQYPNKVGRGAALKAYTSARSRADQQTIMAGLAKYAAKADDRPWCNPATWLNQDRWLDDPAKHSPPKPFGRPTYTDAANEIIAELREHERTQGQGIERNVERLAIVGGRYQAADDDVFGGGG